jgi:cytochrome oxidase Cu insertion factor (SCO1/SenC/PrrC family)
VPVSSPRRPHQARRRGLIALTIAAAAAVAGCSAGSGSAGNGMTSAGQPAAAAAEQRAAGANPDLDPGSSLNGIQAPDFTLTNQFGQKMSLSDFRGKVVILAFTDSECTTVCPLTTQSMLAAKQLLGKAGDQVQLLGVDANPDATAISDVKSYSSAHSMTNQWDFLTGSAKQLASVWKAYDIYVAIEKGQVDHTPALFVIDSKGREQKLYLTTMAYASIGQAAQLLAQESSSLLPGRPSLASMRSLAYLSGQTPKQAVTLNTLPSGSVTLKPGKPRLTVFFATWLRQTTDLTAELVGLNQYVQRARQDRLPGLVAVDEEAAESSPATVRGYLAGLRRPLDYQVALDPSGRVADGYDVQDQPWFVLTSAAGKIVWSHDGWLPLSKLIAAVSKAAG